MSDRYNGYSNRETWAAALYLGNDEGLQQETADLSATQLKAYFADLEDMIAEGNAGRELRLMILDIGSLWRIDWREVEESVKSE